MKKILIGIFSIIAILVFGSMSAFASTTPISDNEIRQGVTDYVENTYPNLSENDKKQLIEELYQEKTDPANQISAPKTVSEQADSLEKSYNSMMEEENYIVDLINGQGEDTSLSNWEFNLNYLKEHYEELSNISGVKMHFIDSYIQSYTTVEMDKDMPKSKVNETTSLIRSTYDGDAAADYALEYCYNYNPDYPNWETYNPGYTWDCANFVSQCLFAGGKSMEGSDPTSFSNWFSYGNVCSTSQVSSTWRGADAFRHYWMSNASSYKTFYSIGSESYNYTWKGDAVTALNSNGRGYHTLICVGYDNPDDILAAHSNDTDSARLSSYLSNGAIVYNMR